MMADESEVNSVTSGQTSEVNSVRESGGDRIFVGVCLWQVVLAWGFCTATLELH